MYKEYDDDYYDEFEEEEKNKIVNVKNILTLVISFLIGQVQFVAGFSPFGIAMLASCLSNEIPLVISFVGTGLGILIKFGIGNFIKYVITTFIFLILTVLFKNKKKIKEDNKDISKLKLFFSVLLVEVGAILLSGQVLIYDLVVAITMAISTLVFYTLFTYGLSTIIEYKDKLIFSIEEVISASILLSLAISSIFPINIFGINFRNVICIVIVLILGWKNGISIGTTAGVTIGSILALVGVGDLTLIASYAISGLFAGVFRKFGKIGVIIGFILGNALITIFANGSTQVIIAIKEILVASVALLVLPKKIERNIDDLTQKTMLLPEGTSGSMGVDEQVIYKLNTVSEVFNEMSETLGESAATIVNNKEEVLQFIEDVTSKVCVDCANSDKCWKKNLYEKYNMIFELIDELLLNNEITLEQFDKIVKGKCIKKEEFVSSLNGTYELYKLNENWKKKLQENREVISKQLKGFSDVIVSIVNEINTKKEEEKNKSKYKLTIGVSKTSKNNNEVNGDNNIILKLDNGKYIIGLSDGMGSGQEADKNSKLVITMLEKFLKSGFNKDTAIKLINSVLLLKSDKDSFATMDISVVDTKTGNVEFVKVGACPTFIKKKDRVEFINSISLPVGIIDNIDIDLCDKKLEDGDLLIMVTDGIIDSNKELNEYWIKELLENTDIDNPQRLADVIIQESVDNTYGIAKDDMTVVVSKINQNAN